MDVIKRLGLVTIIVPFFVLCLVLNIVYIVLSLIWGPIYYIITGNDPWNNENMAFLFIIGESAIEWYMKKFNV